MGQLRDEANKSNSSEDVQQHKLTDGEANYLRMLNMALQYHTLSSKIQSGFLYYVATNRLGYKDGTNLSFQFDFNNQDNVLTIALVSDEAAQQMMAANGGGAPAQ